MVHGGWEVVSLTRLSLLIYLKATIGMGPIGDARIVGILIIAAVVADRGVCSAIAVHFLGFMLEKWIAEEAPARAASRLRGGAHDGGPFDYKIQGTFGCHGHALWIWKHVLLPRFRERRIVRIGHFIHISRFKEIRPSLMGDTVSVKWCRGGHNTSRFPKEATASHTMP
jgi:hypothetical protein